MTNSEELESKIDSLGDNLDGADIVMVLTILADNLNLEYSEMLHSDLGLQLVRGTQSNFPLAFGTIEEIFELTEQLADLD